jgi:hypothetical protein
MLWAFPQQENTFVDCLPNRHWPTMLRSHVCLLFRIYILQSLCKAHLYNSMRVIHKVPQIGGTGPQFCQDWVPKSKVRMKTIHIRVIRKVRKTQHQNPEFGHTCWDSKKNLQKSTLASKGGMKLRKQSILVVNWVSSWLSFSLSASTAATYIFTAPYCTTTIISLDPYALHAEYEHFILRLIKMFLLCGYHWKRG